MHFQRIAAPPLIFDPHPISSVTKGRKNNIPRSIEDLITHINIYFFFSTIFESKIKNYQNIICTNNKKNTKTTRKIFWEYCSSLLNNHQYLDLKPLRF